MLGLDLCFVHSSDSPSSAEHTQTHTGLHHGKSPRGRCVLSVILTYPSLPQSYSTLNTHLTPTPSCINASNPLCGRVTSATVRNRVKLCKHQENGVELPASGITKRSAPPGGRLSATEQNPTLSPSGCSCLPPAGEHTGKTILHLMCDDTSTAALTEGLDGLQGCALTSWNTNSPLGKQLSDLGDKFSPVSCR